MAYNVICERAGIDVIFDPSFEPRQMWLKFNDITLREALEIVRLQSLTAWRPVAPHTIAVVPVPPPSPRGTYVIERGTDVAELKPLSNAPISVRLTANADLAYKTICKLAGINVVIDPDYRPQKLTLELTDVTLNEALEIVRLQSKTVWRAVTPQIIFVYSKETR